MPLVELATDRQSNCNTPAGRCEEGVGLLELARNAQRLFEKQEPHEKRRLLGRVESWLPI
jgi:hypothetical protein